VNPSLARGYQQVQRGVHAISVCGHRIGNRSWNRRQRRLVKNDFNAPASLRTDRRVGQVALHELHRFQSAQIFAFAGNKAIEAANRLAARQQRRGNRAADKPGSSSN